MEAQKPKRRRWQHGRPQLDSQAVRNSFIRIRVSAAELATIQEKANEMHMPVSSWLRHAALSRQLPLRPVPVVNREAYAELGKIGNNINQLVRLAHQGLAPLATGPLEELEALLRKIKLALLGANNDCQAD